MAGRSFNKRIVCLEILSMKLLKINSLILLAVFVAALVFTPNEGSSYLSEAETEQSYSETEELRTGQAGVNHPDSADGGNDLLSEHWSSGSLLALNFLSSAGNCNDTEQRGGVVHFPYYLLYCNLKIPTC